MIARAIFGGGERRDAAGDWDAMLARVLSSLRSSAGVPVTPTSAMKLATYYACVRVLAEDEAKLPLHLLRRLERGKERAVDDRRYGLLHDSPNPEMTAFELRETVMAHAVGRGNGYVYLGRDASGQVAELWPLRPDRIWAREEVLQAGTTGERTVRWWDYQLPSGEVRALLLDQVLHLRGLGFDGRSGYSPAELGKETIGLALAAERYGAQFFDLDATPRVVLKHPGRFKTEKAAQNVRESFEKRLRGLERSTLLAILEEGMALETIGLDNEKAQLLGLRELQVVDVCRWFRMPPHKVAHLANATFSNIEHQSLEYLTDTLLPWLERFEQRVGLSLLTPAERSELFWEHDTAGILRADFVTRMNGYRVGREIGLFSTNDLLEMENRNPIGPEGEYRHMPANWISLGPGVPQPSASPPATRSAAARAQVFLPLFRRVAEEIARRETADVLRDARRSLKRGEGLADLANWLGVPGIGFHRDHLAYCRTRVSPLLAAIAADVAPAGDPEAIEHLVADMAAERCWESAADLREVVRGLVQEPDVDPVAALTDHMAARESTWPAQWASQQLRRAFEQLRTETGSEEG